MKLLFFGQSNLQHLLVSDVSGCHPLHLWLLSNTPSLQMGVSENSVPLKPMVLLIMKSRFEKWLYIIGKMNPTFSLTNPSINGAYPLVICHIAMENGPVEIVDLCWFTHESWWIFPPFSVTSQGFSMVFPHGNGVFSAPGAASLRLLGAFGPAAPEPGPAAARPPRARPAAAAALDGAAHGGHGHAQQRCRAEPAAGVGVVGFVTMGIFYGDFLKWWIFYGDFLKWWIFDGDHKSIWFHWSMEKMKKHERDVSMGSHRDLSIQFLISVRWRMIFQASLLKR